MSLRAAVWRLCSEHRICRHDQEGRKHSGKRPVLRSTTTWCRELHRSGPDTVWLTDITEHPTAEASSTPVASRTSARTHVAGDSSRMTRHLAVSALRQASHGVNRREPWWFTATAAGNFAPRFPRRAEGNKLTDQWAESRPLGQRGHGILLLILQKNVSTESAGHRDELATAIVI